jgi:hypothetical protein
MFVHVKGKHVVSPKSRWHSSASSIDLDAVEPPAPHVTVTKRGRSARDMRSRRARRFVDPIAVLGGKNSREKYEAS